MVDDLPRRVRCKFLGLGYQPADAPRLIARIGCACGSFDERTGSVQESDAIGHLEANPLEGPNLLAEGPAAIAVAGSDLQGRAGAPSAPAALVIRSGIIIWPITFSAGTRTSRKYTRPVPPPRLPMRP